MKRKKKGKASIQFPHSFFADLKKCKAGQCIIGIACIDDTNYPIICACLTLEDIQHFGIDKKPFKFDWNFRYLDDGRNEIIDISLRFKKNEILALLMDPLCERSRQFLKMMEQKRNFGIYYYSKEASLFAGTMSKLDKESYIWAKRNASRAMELQKNRFKSMLKTRKRSGTNNERYFMANEFATSPLRIHQEEELIPIEKSNELLFGNDR